MKKSILWALPTAAIFALPWVHKLAVLNLMTALPDIEKSGAHTVVIIGSLVAVFCSFAIVDIFG